MECDVNACDGLGNTSLHNAVTSEKDSLQKVQCLLNSDDCNPNVCNKDGYAPLHVVCRGENIKILEMLFTDNKCDFNIQDKNGNSNNYIVKCKICHPIVTNRMLMEMQHFIL